MLQNITDMVEPITEEYSTSAANQVDATNNQSADIVIPPVQRSVSLYWDWMETMTQALIVYGPPTLLVLGLVGNILSLLVMLRKAMRKTSVGIYCAALSVVDCLAAQSVLLDQMVRGVTGDTVVTQLVSWDGFHVRDLLRRPYGGVDHCGNKHRPFRLDLVSAPSKILDHDIQGQSHGCSHSCHVCGF